MTLNNDIRTVQGYAIPIWKGDGYRPNNVVAETSAEALRMVEEQLEEGEYIKTVTAFGPRVEVRD